MVSMSVPRKKSLPSSEPSRIAKGRYRHYKGNDYQVIDVARHSETDEWLVVYRPLYGEGGLWARPLALFEDTVQCDGEVVKRFRFIGDES